MALSGILLPLLIFGSSVWAETNAHDVTAACATAIPGPGSSHRTVTTQNQVWPVQNFKTMPVPVPNMTISGNGKPLSPGLIFFEPVRFLAGGVLDNGFIVDQQNNVVYSANVPQEGADVSQALDFRPQTYNGKSYITYWRAEGNATLATGRGYGSVVFLDNSYAEAFNICPPGLQINSGRGSFNCTLDFHEQEVTTRGTLLATAYNVTQTDLSSVGGPKAGWVVDCLLYEIDIASQKILFSWSALQHVRVNTSHLPLGSGAPLGGNGQNQSVPWDWFHLNSAATANGDYLVSGRHTWQVYLVSGKDGSIKWTLDGQTGGDFGAPGANGNFSWQHDVRTHNITTSSITISMMNNHEGGGNSQGDAPSTALLLQLTLPPSKKVTPKVLRRLQTNETILSSSMGSYQVEGLPNNSTNQFVSYGVIPVLREFGPAADGSDLRWEGRFGPDNAVSSYRAFKSDWHATPAAWDPQLGVDSGCEGQCATSAYVSWNGATDVTAWNVYFAADQKTPMRLLGTVNKTGFETQFAVPVSGCTVVGAVQHGVEVRNSSLECSAPISCS